MSPLRCLLLLLSLSPGVYGQAIQTHSGYQLIQPTGHDEIYLLENGVKHHIENPTWFGQNGFANTAIRKLSPAEVDAIPESYPLPEGSGLPDSTGAKAFDGLLIGAKDGRIYVVYGGQRHWVLDEAWLKTRPPSKQNVTKLTDQQLQEIPLGGSVSYRSPGRQAGVWVAGLCLFAFFYFASSGQSWAANRSVIVRIALAALFICAIGMREPYLLKRPRFWAEEGLDWFQYGVDHSIWQTLVYVFPVSNYMNLAANVGAILSSRTASHFGLLYAPAATTWYSYLIQALTIVAILFVRSRLFDSLWKAVGGCLIVLFAATTLDEVWLNSINSMSFLGVISLVLLFAKTDDWSRWTRWGMRAALAFCALSSPYTAALLPMYLLMAWRFQEREQKAQCLVLILCVLIQGGVVLSSRRQLAHQKIDSMRLTVVRKDAAAVNMFVEHMLYPAVAFSAREKILEIAGLKEAQETATSEPPWPMAYTLRSAGWLCLLLIAGTLYLLRGPTLFSIQNLMIATFLSESGLACVASLHAIPTARYAVVPGICFLLILLTNLEPATFWLRRFACIAVLSFGLGNGIITYRLPTFQGGPEWADEIKKWEADPSYTLRVWPPSFVAPVNIVYPHPNAKAK